MINICAPIALILFSIMMIIGIVKEGIAVWKWIFPRAHCYMVSTLAPNNWHGYFEWTTNLRGKALAKELQEVAGRTFPEHKSILIVGVFDCGESK